MGDLIEFYGTECPHCKEMEPLMERLEEDTNLKIERFEVWHNEKNAKLLEQLDQGFCGGVPFFFNRKTGKWICGSTTYDNLKRWATVK